MRAFVSTLALASLALSGCSLLIDTPPYQRNLDRDGGQRDADVVSDGDAGTDPNAPSAPEVRITPESPLTTDDLHMEITTESVDPLDLGPVRYSIVWTRDDAAAPELDDMNTVPASATTKGETWTVEVTPTSADGRHTGPPGTASVTIGNSTPTLGTAGLSDYRPIEGETLEVIYAALSDPDGAEASVRVEWYLGTELVDHESGPRLVLDTRFPPDSVIHARVIPVDAGGAEGAPIETGEAIVQANTLRWRQLEPNRVLSYRWFAAMGDVVYDAPRARALVFDYSATGLGVWEYAFLPEGNRWIQLHPTGTPPVPFNPSIIVDEPNDRLLFISMTMDGDGNAGPLAVTALDLTTRGGEEWRPISPTGEPPAARMLSSIGVDAERHRVVLYGGLDLSQLLSTDPVPFNDLYTLDISTPGAESWESIAIPDPRPTLLGASIIVDASRDRALLVGGAAPGTELGATNTIFTLDLNNLAAGLTSSATTLPVPLFGYATVVDAARDRALIAWGARGTINDPMVSSKLYALNLENLGAEELTGVDAPADGGLHGFIAEDAYAPGRLIANVGGPELLGSAVNLYSLNPADISFTPIETVGGTSPRAVYGAFASADHSGLLMFGGSDGEDTDHVWRWSGAGWSRIAPTDDTTAGNPGPRHGGGTIPTFDTGMWVFGGAVGSSAAETTTWMLQPTSSDATWLARPVPSTDAVPTPNGSASMFDVSCASEGFGLFRGGNTSDVWLFQCNAAGCTWDHPTIGGTAPAIRAGAATGADGTDVVLFGGNLYSDVWLLQPCAAVPAWTAITPDAASGTPAGRRDHRMVQVPTSDGTTRWLVHGGTGSGNEAYADAWWLIRDGDAFRWEPLAADGDGPSGRASHAVVWDGARSRVLIYGGEVSGLAIEPRSDLWELRIR